MVTYIYQNPRKKKGLGKDRKLVANIHEFSRMLCRVTEAPETSSLCLLGQKFQIPGREILISLGKVRRPSLDESISVTKAGS